MLRVLGLAALLAAAAAAPAAAAPSTQARLKLDTALHLRAFTATVGARSPSEGLGVRVVVESGAPTRLDRATVLLNACAHECRWVSAAGVGSDGVVDMTTSPGRFPTDGREDLKVRLRFEGEEHAVLRLPRVAWEYGGDTAWGIGTAPSSLTGLRMRSVSINGGGGPAGSTMLDARVELRGPRATRLLLFAQPNAYADAVQSGGLREERRLTTAFTEHRLAGELRMRRGDLFQVVGEVRHRTEPVSEGIPLLRATLPRPATELTPFR